MKTATILLFTILFLTGKSLSNTNTPYTINTIETLIFKGDFIKAKHIINLELKANTSNTKIRIKLYDVQGDISKLEGDMDAALDSWEKGDKIRMKT